MAPKAPGGEKLQHEKFSIIDASPHPASLG
jgi:hypothetical protein